ALEAADEDRLAHDEARDRCEGDRADHEDPQRKSRQAVSPFEGDRLTSVHCTTGKGDGAVSVAHTRASTRSCPRASWVGEARGPRGGRASEGSRAAVPGDPLGRGRGRVPARAAPSG